MRHMSSRLSAAVALAAAALLLGGWFIAGADSAGSGSPGWEAVSGEVGVGKKVRLEVRLTGVPALPDPQQITVTSTRLDMGPDGMGTMTSPVKPVASDKPGVLAFESELVMAGRWELKLDAQVPGHGEPVKGAVIFTAIDKTPKASATDASGEPRKIVYYRNPMGLADISKEPKKDSMGMDYIPVYEDEVSGPAGSVQISPEKIQRAGVRIEKARPRVMGRSVLATGTVQPDEAKVWITSARFSGFVEKLHVATTGAEVREGEPLMRLWIENGDLLRKQADYISALKSAGDRRDGALERARRNLEAFDFPREAMEEIERTHEPTRIITMKAHASGVVLEKPALEGMRFDAGHMHFKIADLTTIWVIAEVAERDLGLVRDGQKARIHFTAYPGETFEGQVSFIYPDVSMTTRTGRVRIEVPNPDGRLKIGLYADVEITGGASDGPVLAIPAAAIIDNGARRVVMVSKGEGRFEPRDIETGARGGGYVEVRKGLEDGEDIVATGNFLIDAESNLRAALSAFAAPGKGEGGSAPPRASVTE